jgi:hypothetical protein
MRMFLVAVLKSIEDDFIFVTHFQRLLGDDADCSDSTERRGTTSNDLSVLAANGGGNSRSITMMHPPIYTRRFHQSVWHAPAFFTLVMAVMIWSSVLRATDDILGKC